MSGEADARLNTTVITVVISGMLADILILYMIRRQRHRIIVGMGGSSLLLGLVALATLSGLISGWPGLILVIALVILFIGSFYSAVKPQPQQS
jgi:hypothetical protein